MKSILCPILIILSLISCQRDDSAAASGIAEMAIDSVRLAAAESNAGATITVNAFSTMKSNCETFYKFDYTADAGAAKTRNIKAYKLKNGAPCGNETGVASDFSFTAKTPGTYTLRFWTGQGWLEKVIHVQ